MLQASYFFHSLHSLSDFAHKMISKLEKLIKLNNRLAKLDNHRYNIQMPDIYISPDSNYVSILINMLTSLADECQTQMEVKIDEERIAVKEEYEQYKAYIAANNLELVYKEVVKNKQLKEKMVQISDEKLVKILELMDRYEIEVRDGSNVNLVSYDESEKYTKMYNFMKSNLE